MKRSIAILILFVALAALPLLASAGGGAVGEAPSCAPIGCSLGGTLSDADPAANPTGVCSVPDATGTTTVRINCNLGGTLVDTDPATTNYVGCNLGGTLTSLAP